jgi:tetratricopeptide (TPR) repeat protein
VAKKKEHPGETLEQIESAGDRLAEWIGENPLLILGTALGILVVAAGYGFASSMRESSRTEASDALSGLQSNFREAMGADADSVDVPEPANPETAREVRSEYLVKFREMAEEHSGTVAGDLAWIEVGGLEADLGNRDEATSVWTSAAADAAGESTRALLLIRLGGLHEAEGRWVEAGEAYESASQISSYPLRYGALADAARCYAEASEVDRAIGALEIVEMESPETLIPEHIRMQVQELRSANADG